MKNSKLLLACLATFVLAACNPGGGGNGNGPGVQALTPGLTPDGQKVAPLPADKKDAAIHEMTTLSVTNKVFFKHLGLSGSSTSGQSVIPMAANPNDMERSIENGIRGRCKVTPIDLSQSKPDANGNINFTTVGQMGGASCPFTANAKYSMIGSTKGDQNASASNMRIEMNVGLTVQDAAMTSIMDGIQSGSLGGFLAMNTSGRRTGEQAFEMDIATNFDLTGTVNSLKGQTTVRIYGSTAGKSSYANQKSTEIMNSKSSTMIVTPNVGTIVFDVIVITVPGQKPVTKFYLNGEEVSAELGERFRGEDSEYSIQ